MFRLDAIEDQVAIEPSPAIAADPDFRTAITSRRIRDTAMARVIKELYDFSCQVCGIQIEAFEGRLYAEGAHVRPLGRPHLGSDNQANLLCLCPNHHTQLDVGGMLISNDMVAISAASDEPIAQLRWRKNHYINVENVIYHRSLWLAA